MDRNLRYDPGAQSSNQRPVAQVQCLFCAQVFDDPGSGGGHWHPLEWNEVEVFGAGRSYAYCRKCAINQNIPYNERRQSDLAMWKNPHSDRHESWYTLMEFVRILCQDAITMRFIAVSEQDTGEWYDWWMAKYCPYRMRDIVAIRSIKGLINKSMGLGMGGF